MTHPPQLVSLWAMLLTYARAFAMATTSLEYARGLINAEWAAQNYDLVDADSPIGKIVLGAVAPMRDLCERIPSLNIVLPQITRLETSLEHPVLPLVLSNDILNLVLRVQDELSNHWYYPVTSPYRDLYAADKPFGDEVFDAFPSAIRDIQDAGRCLALGQGTATVFHLMRVMEAGLRVLGKELDIPYSPTWEGHLNKIQKKLSEPYGQLSPAAKRKRPIYLEIQGDLVHVKTAWRNPVMHIDRAYEVTEAEDVYRTVRSFMQRMAKHFRERGRPITISVGLAEKGQP